MESLFSSGRGSVSGSWARTEQGKTIVLTTHNMEEAQTLCDEIIIMDQGRIMAQGSPEELMDIHCGKGQDPRNLETVFLNLTNRNLGSEP